MTARRITRTVWAVGGASGPERTDAHDSTQYLLWDGQTGILVDVGTGLGSDALLANIREVCGDSPLFGAVLTHYHADHAGGSAAALAAGLDVYASELTATALAAADEEITQLARARRAGVYPDDYRLAAASGIRILPDGARLEIGSIAVTVLEAPGHCDGHLVLLATCDDTTALFSGDVLFADGRISMQATPDCRLDLYADTVRGLAELDVDSLFPGHGEPVLSGARHDIARAADSFRRLIPPPNLLTA